MACFADINVSQGSVATQASFGEILLPFNYKFTHWIFQWKKFWTRLRFNRIMVISLWPHFFGPPCMF